MGKTATPVLASMSVLVLLACNGTPDSTLPDATDQDTEPQDTSPEPVDIVTEAPCTTDEQCQNGLFCDGVERCSDGTCVAGREVDCNDYEPCTSDVCDEDSAGCLSSPLDEDGDGYSATSAPDGTACPGTDCDDGDVLTHPDAVPDCEGTDDLDCDGSPDHDEDGDGHDTEVCPGGDDCMDQDPYVHPGAPIACSLSDRDCNGFKDSDNDGDGDPAIACGGSDCDDANPGLHSTMYEVVCNGIDDNCDGWLSPVEDADRDGEAVLGCGGADCDDESSAVNTDMPETCNGIDDDCDGSCDELFGCCAGDVDGTCLTGGGVGGARSCSDLCEWSPCCASSEVCGNGVDDDCDGMVDDYDKIAPEQRITIAPGDSLFPDLAWTGSEYVAAYYDDRDSIDSIFFSRMGPDGLEIGSELLVSGSGAMIWWGNSIAWTGSVIGVSWSQYDTSAYNIMFRVLSPTGIPLGATRQLTDLSAFSVQAGITSVVWTGSSFGIVSSLDVTGTGVSELLFIPLSASGDPLGSVVSLGLSGSAHDPSLAWTGSTFGVSFTMWASGEPLQYFALLDVSGSRIGSETRVSDVVDSTYGSEIVWTGSEFGLIWSDARSGHYQIYFTRISHEGVELISDIVVRPSPYSSESPTIAWTGSEYGVAWHDNRWYNSDIIFSRLTPAGEPLSSEIRISHAEGVSFYPAAVWSGSAYGLLWADDRLDNLEIYAGIVACD